MMSALSDLVRLPVLAIGIGLLIQAPVAAETGPPTVQFARDGKSSIRLVIGLGASPASRQTATVLADYLGRISGAHFRISEGDGRQGIAVGCVAEFPALGLAADFRDKGPAGREQYVLRSHPAGLYAIGVGDLAVRHAVWDLLYRLGHRQFFPGPKWEVVPSRRDLAIAVDTNQTPDYLVRNIWWGGGSVDYSHKAYAAWRERNRTDSAFVLNTGHAYDAIIQRFHDVFSAHPEYLGLLDGQRQSSKLCISNPSVRELVVRYAIDYFRKHPESDSVSVEPSDGGGWCECAQCVALGSPSDRALTLANEVSAALEKDWPGKYVGLYAYHLHSPPPKIRARPRVIVSVATSFLRKGWTVDEVIAGWHKQGVAQFGIRDYYNIWLWHHELPGGARGTDLKYLQETIPRFAAMGARFMSAESGDCWGPNGLGYYLAARMMWDVKEAGRMGALRTDFLAAVYGPARGPMDQFYALIAEPQGLRMSNDLVGQMYRRLADAWRLTDDSTIHARLDDLILYTRYVGLYRDYSSAKKGRDRQAAMEAVLRHVYRMRRTMMVHCVAVYQCIERDRSIRIPPEAAWTVPEEKNPWKSSAPWTREELDTILANGIAAHRPATTR
jgi:hypothetical protein